MGEVYGEEYESTLLNRLPESTLFEDGILSIEWGNADETAVATEVLYTNTDGEQRLYRAPVQEDTTFLTDYDLEADNRFQYRTLYLPDSLAIDTFYSAYESVNMPVEYDKSGWTATASSYDERHGTARAPSSAIDNNPATIWVNSIAPQTEFPHTITIDMGATEQVDGLSFTLEDRNETPRTIEISVSIDGGNWTPMGVFSLQNTDGTQYVGFSGTQDIRYFEVTAVEPHGNTPNVVIAEVGAYWR